MKKNTAIFLAVLAVLCFMSSNVYARSATPGCAQWTSGGGDWTFTYHNPIDLGQWALQAVAGTQHVVFTSVCKVAECPAMFGMDSSGKKPVVSSNWNCFASGYRVSDNQSISLGVYGMAPEWYGYYESPPAIIHALGEGAPSDTLKVSDGAPGYTSYPFKQDGDVGPYTMTASFNNALVDNKFGGLTATRDDNCTETTYYRDADNDTYGNQAVSTTACSPPPGYVDNSTGFDCNDNDSTVNVTCTPACTLTVIPKTFIKLGALLNPIHFFIIRAERSGPIEFSKLQIVDWGNPAIGTIARIRLGKKLIFGFNLIRFTEIVAGDYTVTVTYGSPETTACAPYTVK